MNHERSTKKSDFTVPVIIISIILYVVERLLLFGFLQQLTKTGNLLAHDIFLIFFGEPPFQCYSVLFGFDFIFSGGLGPTIFDLFNIPTLGIALIQGAHFAINYGLVYLIFRLISKLKG